MKKITDPELAMKIAKAHQERVGGTFALDPHVFISLKGINYILEFNNRSAKDVFKDTEFNILNTPLALKETQDATLMGCLLFRGLQTNHPELTQDAVDTLFTLRHFPYILSRLRMALDMFLPDLSDVIPQEERDDYVGASGGDRVEEDPTKGPTHSGSDTGLSEGMLV